MSSELVAKKSLRSESDKMSSELNSDILREKKASQTEIANQLHLNSVCRKELSSWNDWLAPNANLVPEIQDWLHDASALCQHSKLPRIPVGFMGPSGQGKSSLLNALLEQENLLPRSGTEACTAVAVEVAFNTSNDPFKALSAVISFMTKQELRDELQVLIETITPDEIGLGINVIAENAQTKEQEIAKAKLSVLYPELDLKLISVDMIDNLITDLTVSSKLGKEVIIEQSQKHIKKFAREIRPYFDSTIRSKKKDARPYWPLVKKVQIFTKAKILSTGLVCVDLPGTGDANAARNLEAERYMSELNAICIITDITRARSSSIARDLYGKGLSLKHRFQQAGLYDTEHVFFVLTKSDIVNNAEVVEMHSENEELQSIASSIDLYQAREDTRAKIASVIRHMNGLASSKKAKSTASKSAKKEKDVSQRHSRRHQGVKDDSRSTPSRRVPELAQLLARQKQRRVLLERRLDKLEADLAKCQITDIEQTRAQFNTMCIGLRNDLVIHSMGLDFNVGRREFEEHLRGEDPEADVSKVDSAAPEMPPKSVTTFCVSATAYQKLCGRFRHEVSPLGFPSTEATMVPQLQKYLLEFPLGSKEKQAHMFQQELHLLIDRMKSWADNTRQDKKLSKHQLLNLRRNFEWHITSFTEVHQQRLQQVSAQLLETMKPLKERAMPAAIKKAKSNVAALTKQWNRVMTSPATFRAICRKQGSHIARTKDGKVNHEINSDLADFFTTNISATWGNLLGVKVPKVKDKYVADLAEMLEKLAEDVKVSSQDITNEIPDALDNLIHNILRHKHKLSSRADFVFGRSNLVIRQPHEIAKRCVSGAMSPGFARALKVTVPKNESYISVARETLAKHAKQASKTMYFSVASTISRELEARFNLSTTTLQKRLENTLSQIDNDFRKMLDLAAVEPNPRKGPAKEALQKEVIEKLNNLTATIDKKVKLESGEVEEILMADGIKQESDYEEEDELTESMEANPEDDDVNSWISDDSDDSDYEDGELTGVEESFGGGGDVPG